MKCLRCGAELQDTGTFCPECSKVTSIPLPPSPFMSQKIVLPKRTPAQSIKKPEPKKVTKKKGPKGGVWMGLCAILLLLTAALVFQGAYIYKDREKVSAELARVRSIEDECVRLTTLLHNAEQEVADLEAELNDLGTGSYLEARNELKEARTTIDTLTTNLARAEASVADLQAQLELLREKTEFFDSHIVFVQEDETNYYHCYDCESFTRNGYRAYNKQQAVFLGYTPCPHCQ